VACARQKRAGQDLANIAAGVESEAVATGYICAHIKGRKTKSANHIDIRYTLPIPPKAKLSATDKSFISRIEAGGKWQVEDAIEFINNDAKKRGKAADEQAIRDYWKSIHILKDSEKTVAIP
jgi:hypothetical protein